MEIDNNIIQEIITLQYRYYNIEKTLDNNIETCEHKKIRDLYRERSKIKSLLLYKYTLIKNNNL